MISAIPRRYAQALLMIAVERKAIEQYENELEKFRQALVANPEVQEFFGKIRGFYHKKKESA